jgi:N-acetylglucosamine kinase-like BadF-type ATPase
VPELVVGVDAGATTTRGLVVGADGTIVGSAVAAGANIRSSAGRPESRFSEVLAGALAGVPAADVRGGVFGVAGAGSAGAEVVAAATDAAWRAAGLGGRPRVVTDLEVAFAAGTSNPNGLLLLAGTGAGAAAFAGRRITRRCDGYGWLLGDEGSAVWLGRLGVQAALAAQDGRGPATRLRTDVAAHFNAGSSADLAQTVIGRVHADAPARLGAVAPLVTRAALDGDAVAVALVEAAAERLVAAVRAVASAEPAAGTPVEPVDPVDLVLAGALLAAGPVRAAVLARLGPDAGLRILDAGPGAAGAAALALHDLAGARPDAARHEAVLRAAAVAATAGAQDIAGR